MRRGCSQKRWMPAVAQGRTGGERLHTLTGGVVFNRLETSFLRVLCELAPVGDSLREEQPEMASSADRAFAERRKTRLKRSKLTQQAQASAPGGCVPKQV